MAVGIYKITSPANKIYIGQSVNINSRFNRHYKHLHNSKDRQPILKNSFVKYGFENHKFEIIEKCEVNKLNERERFWQLKLKPELNCRVQGTKDKSGYLSEETKIKISESKRGQIPWNKGLETGFIGNKKLVLDLNTGIFYETISEASKVLNIKRTTLNAMLSGQTKNKTSIVYV